ncbi:viral A-type inclusion protein, partial [Reticulomyxa filosa]
MKYFEKVEQSISYLYEKQRYQAFDEIKRLVSVMDELRAIEVIKQKTESQYHQINKRISSSVRNVQEDIDKILDSFNKPNVSSVDYDRLFECVLCMSQLKWINECNGRDSNNPMDVVKQKLKMHFYDLEQLSQTLEIDLDHPNFLQARNISAHLGKLRRLEVSIPEITSFCEKLGVQLEQPIRATLATIRREFALEIKDVSEQKKMKESLIQLKAYAKSVHNANLYLKENKFEDVKCLDSESNAMREQLIKVETTFQSELKSIANKIEIAKEKYIEKKKLSPDSSKNNEANAYLKTKGYESIKA